MEGSHVGVFCDHSWRHYLWLSHEASGQQPISRSGQLITRAIYLEDHPWLLSAHSTIFNHICIIFTFSGKPRDLRREGEAHQWQCRSRRREWSQWSWTSGKYFAMTISPMYSCKGPINNLITLAGPSKGLHRLFPEEYRKMLSYYSWRHNRVTSNQMYKKIFRKLSKPIIAIEASSLGFQHWML